LAAKNAKDKAFAEEIARRNAKDEAEREAAKKRMLEKKKEFEAEFKHVWGSSATGLSTVTIDLQNYDEEHNYSANNLISALFEETLIADVHSYKSVTRIHKTGKLDNVNAG
jgi:hypothetical protein